MPQPVPQPAQQPVAQSAPQPVAQPAVQPAPQPAVQPELQPATMPGGQPTSQPVALPAQQVQLPDGQSAIVQPVVVAPPAPAPQKKGSGKKTALIIAAVVAVVAALAVIGLVTGIIGPGQVGASSNAVTASNVTRIVPDDASGARIVEYRATLYNDSGTQVAEIEVKGDGGFTMADLAYPEMKKGSYSIVIVSNDVTYPSLPVNYDPDNTNAPSVVEPVPPQSGQGDKWTIPAPDKGSGSAEDPAAAEERAMYTAYSNVLLEHLNKYDWGGSYSPSGSNGPQCTTGVYMVRLVDFDRDGTDELVLGYYDGALNTTGQTYPDPNNYRLKVFGWKDGSVVTYDEIQAEHTNGGYCYFTFYEGADKTYIAYVHYDNVSGGYNQIYELRTVTDGVFKTESQYGLYGVYTSNYYTEVNGVRVNSQDRSAISNELKKSIGDFTRYTYWCMYYTNSPVEQGTEVVVVRPDDMIEESLDTIEFLSEYNNGTQQNDTVIINKTALAREAFGAFPMDFSFSSGAGGWSTQMTIQPDGTFTGQFRDSDMGDTGAGYEHGTIYCTDFHGSFSVLEKVSDYEYLIQLDTLVIDNADETKTVDQVRQIWGAKSAYGLGVPSTQPQGEWHLYLPGRTTSDLSKEFLGWTFARDAKTLEWYALDDRQNGNGWRGTSN